jgi:ankyrin repeat protein
VVAALDARSVPALTRALDLHAGSPSAHVVVEAARRAWTEGLALLAKSGADLNACHRHYRPLHALIQERAHDGGVATPERLSCLDWLLAHGANPEAIGAWPSARALVIAAFSGEPAYVAAIRRAGARQDVFTTAALGESRAVARRLAADRTACTARDAGQLTALHCAAGSRLWRQDAATAAELVETARVLVDAGADVNAHVRTWGHDVDVAYFAVRSGQTSMLELLLGRGLDATSALPPAAWDGRADLVDLLLTHGASLDRARDGARPLLNELIRWGQFGPARLLLARGASANVADPRGWTALHHAVSRGNARMVEDLIRAGADRDACTTAGETARDLAHARRRADVLRLLR